MFRFTIIFLTAVFMAPQVEAGPAVIWGSPYPIVLGPGGIRMQNSDTTTTCNAAATGSIRYNAGTFEGCNGSAWSSLGGGAATSVLASDGTISGPSISFSADTDTGIYRIGANNIGIVAGTYKAIDVIKSTGNFANVAFGGGAASISDIYPFVVSRDQNNTTGFALQNVNGGASAVPKAVFIAGVGAINTGEFGQYPAAATTHAFTSSFVMRATDTNAGISLVSMGSLDDNIRFYHNGGASTNQSMQWNADYSQQFMQQISTPTTPASGTLKMYGKSDDILYTLNDSGVERPVGPSGWYINASLGGAQVSLGTSSVSSFTEATNASLTLTPVSGSAAAGTMCSATNAATSPSTGATTCAAGSESVGLNFAIPRPGIYEVCAEFGYLAQYDNADTLQVTFQLIETPTNAQTLTLEGGARANLQNAKSAGTDVISNGIHVNTCSFFNWTAKSAGATVGVRLMYEQLASGTPGSSILNIDEDGSNGQRNLNFRVRQVY